MNTKKKTTPAPAPIAVSIAIDPKRIGDLLCSGLESGTHYWLRVDRKVRPPKGTPVWRHAPDLGDGKFPHIDYPLSGGHLVVTDTEEGKKHRLDRAAIERGLAAMLTKAPRHFADFLAEDDDAATADVFIQCCLFGEIVYG